MRTAHVLLSAAAALALTACAETSDDTTTDAEATTAMSEETAPATSDAATPTDAQGFVNAAAASDMFEVEAGKLAQANGASQAVKDFGAMMEREHTQSTAELKASASEAGVTVAPEMTAKQQSDLDALQGAGETFDSLYKTQQIAAHEQALALLRAQVSGGTAPSLKAFAEDRTGGRNAPRRGAQAALTLRGAESGASFSAAARRRLWPLGRGEAHAGTIVDRAPPARGDDFVALLRLATFLQ